MTQLLQEDSQLLARALHDCSAMEYVRLYQAAFRGNVSLLTQLLQEDSQLLVRALHDCSGDNDPLHMAARLGHVDFVKEILTHIPQFAGKLNSQGQAHLHIASAKGHLEVVKELLRVYPDACYLHDKDGKTPLHRAAMKGRVKVLEELVHANEETAWLLTNQGDPVLHVCVHHNQFEALKMLVEAVDGDEFLNLKDDDDNTILHLLVAESQFEVIKFLLTINTGVNVNVVNVDGSTALDVSKGTDESDHWKIKAILKNFKAEEARKISSTWPKKKVKKTQNGKYKEWLAKMKDSLLVVAALMATIMFQVTVSPPGGVWQQNGYYKSNLTDTNLPGGVWFEAGTAILSVTHPDNYKLLTIFTALGLLSSLGLILLLVSGFSFQRKISIGILIVTTWIAVGFIVVTYFISLFMMTTNVSYGVVSWPVNPNVCALWFMLLMCIVFSVHIYRLVLRLLYASGMIFFFQSAVKILCKFCSLLHECGTDHFKRLLQPWLQSQGFEANP